MGKTYPCGLCETEYKIGLFEARVSGDSRNENTRGKFSLICKACGDKIEKDTALFEKMIQLAGQHDRSLLVDYKIAVSNLRAETWMLISKLKKEFEDNSDTVLS
ncbi:MAG: hypothetical protein JRF27_03985 [Deltaproteobacteria bacterium]|nr:hypothetical protein [Deltaproteobacteria bacterium]MBW2192932.1 hypothetical protein [Deltaproteobacteria bacterium]